MSNTMLEKSFHDGYLTGFLMKGQNEGCLCLCDVQGQKYELRLLGVKKLRIDNFQKSNIILAIELGREIPVDDPAIELLLDAKDEKVKASEGYKKYVKKLQDGEWIAIVISPSYGASVSAICESYNLLVNP